MKTTTIFTETFMTTDYTSLTKHELQPENRVGVGADLVESLRLTEGNRFAPIMVSEKSGQMLDGHRRLAGCERAGVPVYFIKIDMKDEALFMARINSTGRQWTTANFVTHFGITNTYYRQLEDFLALKGASVQLVNLFVKDVSYSTIREGHDISHIDYTVLDNVRRTVIFIAGKFDVRETTAMRALKRVMKEFKNLDVDILIQKIELVHKRGDYEGLSFITTDMKLTDLLIKTYRARV